MLFEFDLAMFVADVFTPGQTIRVSRLARQNVVATVAVHIEGIHLSAATLRKLHRVEFPEFFLRASFGLSPPAVLFQEIHTAIVVDVPNSQAVGETLVPALRRDGVKFPLLSRIIFWDLGVSELSARGTDEIRHTVARYIGECGRLVVDDGEHDMALPW